jgi:hypothetical protein
VTESAHTTQTPALTDVNNGAPITTAGTFVFAVAGQVTGIRFWAPATNTGTYTVGLWQVTADDSPAGTGTGTLLASASVAAGSVTANAYNTVPITPVSVDTLHAYRAGVHSSSGRIVATGAAFAAAGIVKGNVTAIQSGADPVLLGSLLNGTFIEGASLAYPVDAFNATDYFPDVEFTTTPPVDAVLAATAPAVTATLAGDLVDPAVLAATAPAPTAHLTAGGAPAVDVTVRAARVSAIGGAAVARYAQDRQRTVS